MTASTDQMVRNGINKNLRINLKFGFMLRLDEILSFSNELHSLSLTGWWYYKYQLSSTPVDYLYSSTNRVE